jgi:hypothetical protein
MKVIEKEIAHYRLHDPQLETLMKLQRNLHNNNYR